VSDVTELLREAMTLHQQGHLVEAGQAYDRVLAVENDHIQALRLHGILKRDCGDFDASISLLSRLTSRSPENAVFVGDLALSYMARGDLHEADELLRKALSLDPESPRELANLGALLQRRGHLREAIALHRRFLEQVPDDLEVRCNLANALMDAGLGQEALEECDATLELAPEHPLLLAARGAVHCGLDEFDQAIEILQPVVSAGDADDMVLINFAYALAGKRRFVDAAEVLQQAIDMSPGNARAVADLGNIFIGLNRAEEAVECCRRFLDRFPGERLVLATFAYALQASGQTERAGELLNFSGLVYATRLNTPAGYDDLGAFNVALADFVENHPSLHDSPVRKSTLGGGQTGELNPLDAQIVADFEAGIQDAIGAACQRFREHLPADDPSLSEPPDSWTLRVWGTVLRSGGRQTPHLHPLAWLSGVYYPRLPELDGDAGSLEFGIPPDNIGLDNLPETYRVAPKAGTLVLFPSYFYHCTRPFVADQSRVSVAFDVIPAWRGG
jgi:uncharacterized protein (TIGR02466 family)